MSYRWHELGYTSYTAYLHSPSWQEARLSMIQVFGDSCEHCGSDDGIQIHHFTYERLGDETADDLAVLCWSCHADIHEFPEYGQRIARHIQVRRRAWAEAGEPDLYAEPCLESEEWR